MITDAEAIQNMVNKVICFHCKKVIFNHSNKGNSYYMTINLENNFHFATSQQYLISKYKQKSKSGQGAILRFHLSCFSAIAGEEYMFDPEIWK